MIDITKYIKTAANEIERNQINYEKTIHLYYKNALIEAQGKMVALFKKYERDGKLSLADMTRYNRYASMEKELMSVIDPAVRKTISDIKRLLPSQYEESFYRYAWAIDNGAGIRLNWGLLNHAAVVKLFSIANPNNLYFAEALHNYPIDAQRALRRALMSNLTTGKTLEQISNDIQKAINVTEKKGILIARTEGMTAINAGTNYAYTKAKEKGVEGYPIWIATLDDDKTRYTHRAMDGALLVEDYGSDANQAKWVLTSGATTPGPGGNPAPYPGYEGLPAEERINCRCTLGFNINDFSPVLRRTREQGVIPYQTYEKWNDGRVKTPEPVKLKKKDMLPKEAIETTEGIPFEGFKKVMENNGYGMTVDEWFDLLKKEKGPSAVHVGDKEKVIEVMKEIDEYFNKSHLGRYQPMKDLDKLIETGEIQNLFSTGTSRGSASLSARNGWEYTMFQGKVKNPVGDITISDNSLIVDGKEITPTQRPKYGMRINNNAMDAMANPAARHYGEVEIIFDEKKLKNRVTYSLGNSSRQKGVFFKDYPFASYNLDRDAEELKDIMDSINREYTYLEAQIWGPVNISTDVKEIILKEEAVKWLKGFYEREYVDLYGFPSSFKSVAEYVVGKTKEKISGIKQTFAKKYPSIKLTIDDRSL